MKQMLKGGTAGAILATVVLFSGAAFAGTGVGGVFNLGQTNQVNAATTLKGSANSGLLKVTNTNGGSSATGLKITVPAGRAPFVTNSGVKVTKLNADKVDGQSANGLVRIAGSSTPNTSWAEDGRTALQTVTIMAPQQGFVFLSGSATPGYVNGCTFCAVHLRFHDVEADTDTVTSGIIVRGTGEQYAPLAVSVTLPVSAGTHTFQLVGSWYDVNATSTAPGDWYDTSASAMFVRFNGVGTSVAPRPATKAPVPGAPRGSSTQH